MTPLPTPRALLIDLDGTLVDTLGDFQAALDLTLADDGLPPAAPELVARTIGRGTDHLLRRVWQVAGRAPDDGLAMRARYLSHYARVNGRAARVLPGAAELLAATQAAGLATVCVTNKPQALADSLLAAIGLRPTLAGVIGGDPARPPKPDPASVQAACRWLGVAPWQAWMVGDSRNDAEAARAAGCPCVLVRGGYNHGEPLDAVPAHAHVDSLHMLVAWLRPGSRQPPRGV